MCCYRFYYVIKKQTNIGILNILIVESFSLVREGMVKILQEAFPAARISGCANYSQAFEFLIQKKYEIVILDILLSGKSGLELLDEIKSKYPKTNVLVLSSYPENQFAVRSIKSGASAYLTKAVTAEELIKAIKTILGGELYITQIVAELLAQEIRCNNTKHPHKLLSDKEYCIFRAIASGKNVSSIAAELCLSVKTISAHRANILKKMNLKNNAEIMHYAFKYKLIDADFIH